MLWDKCSLKNIPSLNCYVERSWHCLTAQFLHMIFYKFMVQGITVRKLYCNYKLTNRCSFELTLLVALWTTCISFLWWRMEFKTTELENNMSVVVESQPILNNKKTFTRANISLYRKTRKHRQIHKINGYKGATRTVTGMMNTPHTHRWTQDKLPFTKNMSHKQNFLV